MTPSCSWKLESVLVVTIFIIAIHHTHGQSDPQKPASVDSGPPSEQSILDKSKPNSVETVNANATKTQNGLGGKTTELTNKSAGENTKTKQNEKPQKNTKPKRRRRPTRRRRPRRRKPKPGRKPNAANVKPSPANNVKDKITTQPVKTEKNTQPETSAAIVTGHSGKAEKLTQPDKPNIEVIKVAEKVTQPVKPNDAMTQTADIVTKPDKPNDKATKTADKVTQPDKPNNKVTKAADKGTQPDKPNNMVTKTADKVTQPDKPNNKVTKTADKVTQPDNTSDKGNTQPAKAESHIQTHIKHANAENPAIKPPKSQKGKPLQSKNTLEKKVSPKNKEQPKQDSKPMKPKAAAAIKSVPNVDSADSFFDNIEFDPTTTTESPNAAPPEFDPKPKQKEKKMPVVDTENSISHDGTACNVTYREHETDPTKFMMRLPEDVWIAADCPPNRAEGLVWRQDLCSCGEKLVAQDPDDWCGHIGFNKHPTNSHKYIRRHHGVDAMMDCASSLVWSQKLCLCLYGANNTAKPMVKTVDFVCKTILNLTFEHDLRNTEGYYVKPVPLGRKSKISRIRYVKTQGSNSLAAQIIGQPLEFLAFSGNDFQKHVTYSLNFKVSPRRRKSQNFMALLSDACRKSKRWEPSIDLSFQPSSGSFRLLFRTDESKVDTVVTGAKPNKSGWYKTVVYFEDQSVTIQNNGQKLHTETGVSGKVPPNRCPLYIAGRGSGQDKKDNFYGYMDNVFLMKDCNFSDANIKIL